MRFQIKAVDAAQKVLSLTLESPDEMQARDQIQAQGLAVLSLKRPVFSVGTGRARFPTQLFSIELLSLLEAGLSLVEALQALAEKKSSGDGARVVSGILEALYRGESFSQAIGRHPEHFSALYVATVKASERTGDLKEALSRYIAYEEELDRVRKKLLSALIYPAILVVVGALVLAFLMFYVVPRFARVYEDISTGLPFFSGLLLKAGGFMQAHALLVLAGLIAVAAAATYALSQESVRARLNARAWEIPRLGERMRIYQLARLYRTVGMLLRAGVPLVRSLDMVSGLLAPHLRTALARARQRMEEGRAISQALADAGLATPVANRMLLVGERSGSMGEMMDRIARVHDEETSRFIDRFVRVFEPILMAVLGLAVGSVVVLMYMPIFELAGSIQ